MYHIFQAGVNNRVLVLFHGTGGDAKEMIGFGLELDKKANLLSIEGDVRQWRMNRYFIRHDDGSFDLQNLEEQTEKYYQEVLSLLKDYDLEDKEIILVGYSNGANLIQSMMRNYELKFHKALLLHPSLVNHEKNLINQPNIKILLTSGDNDPYLNNQQYKVLVKQFKTAVTNFTTYRHASGHAITREEVAKAQSFISE
jgi:phospholipase/carboxylesterase